MTTTERRPSRAQRIALAIQRAAIRRHLSSADGRAHLRTLAPKLDFQGALALVEEIGAAPAEDRLGILTLLAHRPEADLRNAALRALHP